MFLLALATCLTAFAYDAPVPPANPHRKVASMRVSRERSHARRTAVARRHAGRESHRAASPSSRTASRRSSARNSQRGTRSSIAAERASALHRSMEREKIRNEEARELRIRRERAEESAAEVSTDHKESAVDETQQTARADRYSGRITSLSRPRREVASAPASEIRSNIDEESRSDTEEDTRSNTDENATVAPDTALARGTQTAAALNLASFPGAEDLQHLAEEASLSISRGGMPPPLRGSLALLERQDERLDADGLERIEDEADLSARIAHHLLVPLPVSDALTVNAELPPHHRYCRPWTARFLTDLARAHEVVFHRPLEVSSAVRTVEYQEHLERINGNAAPAEGALVSPHLMGATIDIAKKQMSLEEIAWMRRRLLALELAGKIDVEEEFEQACFHITVYRNYVPSHSTQPHPGPSRRRARRGVILTNAVADAVPSGQ